MPDLRDTAAALAEIDFALDILKADGVMLMTRYGDSNRYLGHADFAPIWEALEQRHAVVLVHPTHAVDTNHIAKGIPQPIVDYPHETTRSAVDIIMSNGRRKYSHVKVILAHAGGTLPYLARRICALSDVGLTPKTEQEILQDLGSFYFDVALSSTQSTIDTLLTYTKPSHILYGSDYPYAPQKTIEKFAQVFEQTRFDEPDIRYLVSRGNALKLFPRFETARERRGAV
jgi:6-methylsalicylate decarboxylase